MFGLVYFPATGICAYLLNVQSIFCNAGSGWACNEIAVGTKDEGWLDPRVRLPTLDDYPIILRGSKAAISDRTPSTLYARACRQGWPDTYGRPGRAGE